MGGKAGNGRAAMWQKGGNHPPRWWGGRVGNTHNGVIHITVGGKGKLWEGGSSKGKAQWGII